MGASVKAGSPVDCRAASGPKPAVRAARRKHAGAALRAVAPTISTTFQDSGKNARVLLFQAVLTDKPSDIKAFGLSHKSFQTHFRSFQTQKTGNETGGFLMVLGMKCEDFDSFAPGESE